MGGLQTRLLHGNITFFWKLHAVLESVRGGY